MRRRWSLIVIVVIALFMIPRPARAWDWWDWAQEFSGPGPFHPRGNIMAEICPGSRKVKDAAGNVIETRRTVQAPFDATDRVPCFFFDLRRFENDEFDNFGAGTVTANWYEAGASMRLNDAFDLGFGLGAVHTNANDHGETRWVITAPRLVFKPIMLFKSDKFWTAADNRTLRRVISAFKFYVRGNIIVGDYTGEDFGLQPGDANFNFRAKGDRLISAGFIIDVTAPFRVD